VRKTSLKPKTKNQPQGELWHEAFSAGELNNPLRTIEWFGGVTHSNLEEVLGKIKTLLASSPQEEIQLIVNSHGGATGIGMAFYDTVRSVLKPTLTTIGSGDVDSSGIIVFLAGKKRYLTKNTTLLLHLAGRTFGTEKRFSTLDLENILKEDKLKDYQYACVVSDATEGKWSPEKVLELMANNTVFTAEEAVSMGIAHKVLE
jgi:ATP-dependent Clp protease protease subunit